MQTNNCGSQPWPSLLASNVLIIKIKIIYCYRKLSITLSEIKAQPLLVQSPMLRPSVFFFTLMPMTALAAL